MLIYLSAGKCLEDEVRSGRTGNGELGIEYH